MSANYIWLFTRPLSGAILFPPLASSSEGKPHLRHWGVLCTRMTMADTNAPLQRTIHYSNRDTLSLGWMFELFQDEYSKNNVNIMREFNLEALKEHWPTFSAQYVGITEMTCEQIKFEGTSLNISLNISATYS
jgi:hypothetical protein